MTLSRLELAARDLGLAVERFALALAAELAEQPPAPVFVQQATARQERFLNVQAAAARADRHPNTLRLALALGELHGVQTGARGRWTIQTECLDAWAMREKCEHQKAEHA